MANEPTQGKPGQPNPVGGEWEWEQPQRTDAADEAVAEGRTSQEGAAEQDRAMGSQKADMARHGGQPTRSGSPDQHTPNVQQENTIK